MSKILSTSTSSGTEVYQKYMATSSNTDVLSGSEIVCQNNIDSTPIICTTDAEMEAVLSQGSIGKVYKFSGNNSSTYQDGDICVVYEYVDTNDYLCFTALENTNIWFTNRGATSPVIYYSLDKLTWTLYPEFGTSISLTTGQTCYWKGDNDLFASSMGEIVFRSSGRISASGTIMSLLDSTCQLTTIDIPYCFYNLFSDCTTLVSPPRLSATTLASDCYAYMFSGCTSLYIADSSSSGYDKSWTVPSSGVFTNTTSQTGMFTGCLGTRSSNDMVCTSGQSKTYYTQNTPV